MARPNTKRVDLDAPRPSRRSSNHHQPTHRKKSSHSPSTSPRTIRKEGPAKTKSVSAPTRRSRSDNASRSHSIKVASDSRRRSGKMVEPTISLDTVTTADTAETGDTVESEPEEGKRRMRRREEVDEEGSATESESDSYSEEDDAVRGRKDRRRSTGKTGRAKRRVSRNGGVEEADFEMDGKKLSMEQVQMVLRLLGKTASEGLGKKGEDALDEVQDDAAGDEEEVIELDIGREDGEDYDHLGRQYQRELQDQLQAINASSLKKLEGYSAEGVLQSATECLEARLGGDLLHTYHTWQEAEQTYKADMKKSWSDMVHTLHDKTTRLAELTKKIEAAAAERMKVVSAARKDFEAKSDEQRAEIEGFQIELDKSQKKAVKAYKKFTDDETIGKDVGMKLKDAMNAYAEKLIVGGKSRGKKRKAEEDDDDDEEEEEVEEDDE